MVMHPDFSGLWRADLAASRLHGPIPDEIVVSVVHSEPELLVQMTITASDKAPMQMTFRTRTGELIANTVLGSGWISRSQWVGDELLIESEVSQAGRQLHFCDYWSLSRDGRRLTMEHRGDDLAGQVTVLDRQERDT